ncbi:MAG: 30S ribosomal protein S17 [Candidatus Acidiferrales bacterium]
MANEQAANAAQESHQDRGVRQELTGVVTSTKMQKTIVVKVTRAVQHPLYQRVVRHAKKYYAHDETGEAHVGDTVRIVSTRPLSKLKRWRLQDVVQRSTRALPKAEASRATVAKA